MSEPVAILFYGYVWPEHEDNVRLNTAVSRDATEWHKVIAGRRGHRDPWDDRPEGVSDDAYHTVRAQDFAAWYATLREIVTEFGVNLGFHGEPRYQTDVPHLYVDASRIEAECARAVDVDADHLDVLASWDRMLARWLAEFGLEAPQDRPRWWLVAQYA